MIHMTPYKEGEFNTKFGIDREKIKKIIQDNEKKRSNENEEK